VTRLILKEVYEGLVATGATMGNSPMKIKDPLVAKYFLLKYKESLEKKGIKIGDNPQSLGHGDLGSAFKLSDNTVLKITEDATEAKAARHILGKNFKNVYHIHAVFELGDTKVYVIWQEFLDGAPLEDVKEDPIMRRVYYAYKDRGTLEREFSDEQIAEYLHMISALDDTRRKVLFKLLHDLRDGLKQLRSAGIKFIDYHLNNIMYRKADDQYVIIDLGNSDSAGLTIDTVESDKPAEQPQAKYDMPIGEPPGETLR
jgi:hypothetical protein